MARKHDFASLNQGELPAGNFSPATPPSPLNRLSALSGMASRPGALGAVARGFEQVLSQSVIEIDPEVIDASPIADRLSASDEDIRDLVESMRERGQQVPILVRPHPAAEGRYQVAYGRRRVQAAKLLGCKVRSVIKHLTDDELVVAQGQENSARKDLSFIERALFASRLEEGGYDRSIIMSALSVDKTGLSRLISSAVKIPSHVIEAIGPAPKTGRDRWVELATQLEKSPKLTPVDRAIADPKFAQLTSDERFDAVLKAVASKASRKKAPTVWATAEGTRIAKIKSEDQTTTLVLDKKLTAGFGAYLVESLPEIYAAFKRREEA